jgi:PilZ domain-containing protein
MAFLDIEGWQKFQHNSWVAGAGQSMSKTGAPPKTAFHNTRRFPRFALDVRLTVNVFREGSVINFWGRSTELGEDGIGGTLTGDLVVGEVVSMEFPLPGSAYPCKLRAIVRFRHGLHYGFEFLTVSAEQRKALKRVTETLAASGISDSSL